MSFKFRIPLLIGIVAVGATAMGQSTTKITYDGRPERLYMPRKGLSMMDTVFMKEAACSNAFEIMSSELALQRGSSTFVRQYAKEMIMDHKTAQNALKLLAEDKGVDLPSDLKPEQKMMLNKLKGLRGAQFDRAYQMAQMKGHQKAVALFEKQVKGGHDSDVRNYATLNLPAITMHLKMVKEKKTMTGPTKAEHNM